MTKHDCKIQRDKRHQKWFTIYWDPKEDLVIFGANSKAMAIYRGNMGYREFAAKRIGHTSAHMDASNNLFFHPGGFYRFDERGLINAESRDQRMEDALDYAIFPPKSVDQMTARRVEESKFNISWEKYPTVARRVSNFILHHKRLAGTITSRTLTPVYEAD